MSHESEISKWVRMSLAFHNLNKGAESHLGLSLVQYYLLMMLRDMPGCSPQKLAVAVGMHPSSLTQSLKRLKKKRALYVAEDPKDSRKKILSLSREGLELLEKFSSGFRDLFKEGEFLDRVQELGLRSR
ncbi:MAG: MarR family transcriptional regulator [Bdellovibrionales bacterium]|nr:MarR family transcriptional regulator [Bdellovibrionales bacterium]